MDLKKLKEPLEIKDIDFRVQSVNKGGYATILAYKDARVDMNRLDDVCGAENWKREHFDNNTKCRVSIWNDKIKEWISKEDIGTPSNTEAQKGLASDSFKRACFNWGIGRELYDYPITSIKLTHCTKDKDGKYNNDGEYQIVNGKAKSTFGFKLKEWVWHSQFTDGRLTFLMCRDNLQKLRFTFGTYIKPVDDKK